ncbi:flagellar hook protein FlgE [Isachenkonia alkalipeptolytica]|uniref:Flagellar hook protein FlgE n=1 Tax=Isachenkonia alkalipeptolytica TaxID=2565777 RepID=A0AA43XJM0_9CLOT|nr:flagellar hook protein FlgE [Isachenkonia alkalipeptolytica]NBG87571.1 flagellar hook protein FlgE [Isachenkonia alkalipeptolytica]
MMRSMFSGVSGLSAHQLKMDTVGNNIANVNTVGYKGSRTTFQEVFTQTIQGAGAPQDGLGGTNPRQVGLGIDVSSMDTFHIQGAVERTDYATDMMINGEGFFMVSDDPNFADRSYTRAGNFSLDGTGNLVTPNGERVLGYLADEAGNLGNNIEGIQISQGETFPPQATENVELTGTLNSRVAIASAEGDQPEVQDVIENISEELTDEQRATIADRQNIQVFDSLGGMHNIELAFIKTGEDTYQVEAFYLDDDGNLNHIEDIDDNELTFDGNGSLTDGGAIQIELEDLPGGAEDLGFNLDLSNLKMFDNPSNVKLEERDGYSQGALEDFSVSQTGEVIGNFDNGQRRILGQMAIASFTNPGGLEKTGGNNYRETANSGNINVGNPGTQGLGVINSGALEMSNVDLSKEFTDMITTQRGFQANSRIITTSDEMLQEVVNMKR